MDVVGVGALNLDLITGASALHAHSGSVLDLISAKAGVSPPLARCTERLVDAHTVRTALDCLEALGVAVTPSPGGSAFNTLHALARMETGLTLGYVGVAGRPAGAGQPWETVLDGLGIDRSMVRTEPDTLTGVCLSVYDDGERTLLTHTGANTDMARHVRDRFGALVDRLARARVVLVTSFLDPDGCAELHRLLAETRRRSPSTLIAFDPGHVWSCDPPAGAVAVAELCDVLLVNGQEHTDLVPRLAQLPPVVVVKRPDRVELHRGGAVETCRHEPLAADEVEDATGAGDVFTAGLIAAVAGGAPLGAGVRLGMAAARHKLRHVGAAGHAGLASLSRSILGAA